MGLDNNLEMKVTNRHTGTTISREVCYWRKFWGLRDKILHMFDMKDDELSYVFNDAATIHDLIELIDTESERAADEREHLSHIWEIASEYRQCQQNLLNLKIVAHWLDGHFGNDEFFDWFIHHLETYSDNEDADKFFDEVLAADRGCEPLEFEIEFEFVDSY